METTGKELNFQDYVNSLSEPEKKYHKGLLLRLQDMRDAREMPYKERDGLTFTQRYELNSEIDLAYNNLKGDLDGRDKGFSMRTGVSRQKTSSILSYVNGFEFDPTIHGFDKHNRLVNELGDNVGDLVKRSREIEKYDDKRSSIYRELIAQGQAYVEEDYISRFVINSDAKNKDGKDWKPGDTLSEFVMDDKPLVTIESTCEANLILGKYVYLSSLNEQDIQKQSLVATYREISQAEFERIYGTWDRAEYVRATVKKGAQCYNSLATVFDNGSPTGGTWATNYFWNIQKPGKKIGLLKIYEPFSNRYMLLANGVMMLPLGYPLSKVSPSGKIPLAKAITEKIPGFAEGKGIPANTYVDEKLYDFVYQAMVKKMMQSAEPTLGNLSGKTLPRDFFTPGAAYNEFTEKMFQPLLPEETRTVTTSDTNIASFVKDILNSKSVDDSFSAGNSDNTNTATVYLQQQKQTISKLFQVVDAVRSLERQLTELRIPNILTNWTTAEHQEIEQEVVKIVDDLPIITGTIKKTSTTYRQEEVKTKLNSENQSGTKIIRFTDGSDVPDSWDLADEEENLTKSYQQPVRIAYLHAPSLSRIWDWNYWVDIIARDTASSAAEMLAYLSAKQQVVNLIATDQAGILNKDYTMQRLAEFQDEDPDKAYNLGQEGQQQALQQQVPPDVQSLQQQNATPKAAPAMGNPIGNAANAMRPTAKNLISSVMQ